MATNAIAILRRCRRCFAYRSIDQFKPLGKLCMDCTRSHPKAKAVGSSRGYALTPKARAYLNEGRVAAA